MKAKLLMISFFCAIATGSAIGEVASKWIYVHVNESGMPQLSYVQQAQPKTLGDNEYPESYQFPTNAQKYWKKVGTDWVAMTAEEQAAVDAAEQAAIDAKKTAEQKTAENAFFTLTETILTAVSDPRAGKTPPIKLSFSEINGLIKTIQGADPMAAINFSLELLAVDAELKRFDVLWWDKASSHVIEEPPAQ